MTFRRRSFRYDEAAFAARFDHHLGFQLAGFFVGDRLLSEFLIALDLFTTVQEVCSHSRCSHASEAVDQARLFLLNSISKLLEEAHSIKVDDFQAAGNLAGNDANPRRAIAAKHLADFVVACDALHVLLPGADRPLAAIGPDGHHRQTGVGGSCRKFDNGFFRCGTHLSRLSKSSGS